MQTRRFGRIWSIRRTAWRTAWNCHRASSDRQGVSAMLAEIERRVLAGLKAELRNPRAIARYLQTYQEERKKLAAESSGKRRPLEKQLAQVARELKRAMNVLVKELVPEAAGAELVRDLHRQKVAIEADLAAIAPVDNVVALHPASVSRYLASVETLAETIERRLVDGDEEPAGALRELVVSITIQPRKGAPDIMIAGRLAKLAGAEIFPEGVDCGSTVVAGAGLEPATSGL